MSKFAKIAQNSSATFAGLNQPTKIIEEEELQRISAIRKDDVNERFPSTESNPFRPEQTSVSREQVTEAFDAFEEDDIVNLVENEAYVDQFITSNFFQNERPLRRLSDQKSSVAGNRASSDERSKSVKPKR